MSAEPTSPPSGDGPVRPALAEAYARHPDLDATTRVHLALDAGFEDPDFTEREASALADMSPRRLRYMLAAEDSTYRDELLRRRMAKAEIELRMHPNFLDLGDRRELWLPGHVYVYPPFRVSSGTCISPAF